MSWSLTDLPSRENRGPSALRRIQKLFQMYGLTVLSDARFLQGVIDDGLAALASAGGDGATPADQKNSMR